MGGRSKDQLTTNTDYSQWVAWTRFLRTNVKQGTWLKARLPGAVLLQDDRVGCGVHRCRQWDVRKGKKDTVQCTGYWSGLLVYEWKTKRWRNSVEPDSVFNLSKGVYIRCQQPSRLPIIQVNACWAVLWSILGHYRWLCNCSGYSTVASGNLRTNAQEHSYAWSPEVRMVTQAIYKDRHRQKVFEVWAMLSMEFPATTESSTSLCSIRCQDFAGHLRQKGHRLLVGSGKTSSEVQPKQFKRSKKQKRAKPRLTAEEPVNVNGDRSILEKLQLR